MRRAAGEKNTGQEEQVSVRLGVNVDHVATIREARKGKEPDPVFAAHVAEMAGADQITIHLREDRRHIQDRDLHILRQTVFTAVNLEMAVAEPIIRIALDVKPEQVTLVPERRQEITTEGGLDVAAKKKRIAAAVKRFHKKRIKVSLFIGPDPGQIEASAEVGADAVELHTGAYANAHRDRAVKRELKRLTKAAELADSMGLIVAAGHGLNYHNVEPIVAIPQIVEVNIGHSIVSRAVFTGLEVAIRDMKSLLVR
jgi:pyridoxine 5-phosphate synthase